MTFSTKAEKVRGDDPMTFAEKATIVHDGQEFTSGGGFIGQDKNGRYGGLVYAFEGEKKVGDWGGTCKVDAHFGSTWRSNWGDVRQSVHFTYNGVRFYGVYFKSGSDIVRVRQIN